MDERRIGIYGGTFDPIHNGHIEVARTVVYNFALDELFLIPASRPPHKTGREISSPYHRFAMLVLATIEEPQIKVSTAEIEAPDKPYSFQTVERLREALGEGSRLFFVIGADSFEEINTWREPARLLSSADLVVVTRPGSSLSYSHLPAQFLSNVIDLRGGRKINRAEGGGSGICRIYLTDYVNRNISSTEIRRSVRKGEKIGGLVPACVADYIEKYGLYRR